MVIPSSRYEPVMFGTYEMELHEVIERLVATGFRTIVNCGAGRGYYALGLAVRCPNAQVIAFETRAQLRADLERAARANGVGHRVVIGGTCNAAVLRECLASACRPVLVLADIEGIHQDAAMLGAPLRESVSDIARSLPALDERIRTAYAALIETHDDWVLGTTEQLLRRFARTHGAEAYLPRDRTRRDLPRALASGPWRALSWVLVRMMREPRFPHQQWVLFTPSRAEGGRADAFDC